MQDFRAIVDYFGGNTLNRTLIDPSRYLEYARFGVMALAKSQIADPTTECEVQEVRLEDGLMYHPRYLSLKILDNVLPVWCLVEDVDHSDRRGTNLNQGSLLLAVNASIKARGKIVLPITKVNTPAVTYLREDGKALLKHHYEALSAFVGRQVLEAAGARGVPYRELAATKDYEATRRGLKKQLTRDKFRKFWVGYCKTKRYDPTPCPLDM